MSTFEIFNEILNYLQICMQNFPIISIPCSLFMRFAHVRT